MLPFRSGRFRKLGAAGLFLSFVFLLGVTLAAAPKPSPTKTNSPGATTTKSPAPLSSVPLPIGQEAKGLVLPDFDITGRMRSRLEATVAKRIDADHMSFKAMKMTTYTPQNAVDLMIEMPSSVLDLNTRVVVSHERTTVKRSDFHISGDEAEFDTIARKGTLSGNVKMVITDSSQFQKKPAE
ncbi:MAG: hypothetical protein ACXWAV_09330 [Chthoniobacterales bacterium]